MKTVLPVFAAIMLISLAGALQAQNMPDLYIEDSDVSTDADPSVKRGADIEVTGIVKNQGSATTQGISVNVYISQYASLDYRSTLLKSTFLDEDLANYSGTGDPPETSFIITGTIPESLRKGTYYIHCLADADSTYKNEDDETNNVGSTSIDVTADLADYQINSITLDNGTVTPGSEVSLNIEIENSGLADGPAGTKHVLYIYIAADNSYNSWEDFLDPEAGNNASFLVKQVDFDAINKEKTSTIETSFYMPTYFYEGCFLYAFFNIYPKNEDEDMEELSYSNNISSLELTSFGEYEGSLADVGAEIEKISPDYKINNKYGLESRDIMIGTSVDLIYNISNFGNYQLNMRSSDFFVNKIYFSTDRMLDNMDKLIGNDTIKTTVYHGKKYQRYFNFTLGSDITADEEYYIIVEMDATGRLSEADLDANNIVYSHFKVKVVSTNDMEEQFRFSGPVFSVYPNPATDVINYSYELEEKADVYVKLYSQQGNCVYQNIYNDQIAGNYTKQINEDLPSGIYYLSLYINGEILSQKLLVY